MAALAERPELSPDLNYIWEGFWVLSGSRQMGWGVGPIPLTEIQAYIELFAIEDRYLFVSCIREMDRVYLEKVQEEKDNKSDATQPER